MHRPFCICGNKNYSKLPVRVITAESTASGAVSHRRMRGPRPTGTGDEGNLQPLAVGRLCVCQQLAQGRAAQLVAEEHEIVPFQAAAEGPEVGQGQGDIRQHAPAALLGGFKSDAVVALVFLLLLFGGGHTVPAEEGHEVGAAQLHAVADDLFQLVLLGVTHEQGHFHAGFGGAGIARLHAELHRLRPEAGDGGGVFHGVAVT